MIYHKKVACNYAKRQSLLQLLKEMNLLLAEDVLHPHQILSLVYQLKEEFFFQQHHSIPCCGHQPRQSRMIYLSLRSNQIKIQNQTYYLLDNNLDLNINLQSQILQILLTHLCCLIWLSTLSHNSYSCFTYTLYFICKTKQSNSIK